MLNLPWIELFSPRFQQFGWSACIQHSELTAPKFGKLVESSELFKNLLKWPYRSTVTKLYRKGTKVSLGHLLLFAVVIHIMVTPKHRLDVVYALLFMLLLDTKRCFGLKPGQNSHQDCMSDICPDAHTRLQKDQDLCWQLSAMQQRDASIYSVKTVAEHGLPK